MKFSAEQSILSHSLTRMVSITENRNVIPILGHVLIEAKDDSVYLSATDMDTSIKERIDAKVSQSGSTTVSAKMLNDIVRKLDKGDLVSIILDDKDDVKVKSGKSNFKLKTLPPNDFPVLASDKFESSLKFDAESLKNALEKTKWSVSTESTRYYLQGVAMQHIEGNAYFISTDGHKLSRYIGDAVDAFPDIIVPTKTVAEWHRILESGEAILDVSETKTRLTFGDITIVSKGVDGTFPAWQRVVPTDNPNKVTCDSATLIKAIDRVATIASDKSRAVKFSIADASITLTVVDPTVGDSMDVVDAEIDGDSVDVGVNSKYIMEAFSKASGGDVIIQYRGRMDQIVITYENEPTYLSVVMPMNVN